jgi:hypothetical protein
MVTAAGFWASVCAAGDGAWAGGDCAQVAHEIGTVTIKNRRRKRLERMGSQPS